MNPRNLIKIVLMFLLAVGIVSHAPAVNAASCTNGTDTGTCVSKSTQCPSVITDVQKSCPTTEKCCKSSPGTGGPGGTSSGSGIEVPDVGLSTLSIVEILATVLQWLIRVFLLLAVISFVVTGIQFLVAMGSAYSGAAQNAKKNFGYSILAVVVVGASYILITTIAKLLGGVE